MGSGELLALAEGRVNNCLDHGGPIWITARISGDNGQTWGPLIEIARNILPDGTEQVAQNNYVAAKASLGKGRDILQRLAERDRTMSEWRTSLAAVFGRLGNLHWLQKELVDAQTAYEAALQIMRELSGQDPGNLPWRRELAVSLSNVARVMSETPEGRAGALALFEEASAIYAALVAEMPENESWAAEQKRTSEELTEVRQSIV